MPGIDADHELNNECIAKTIEGNDIAKRRQLNKSIIPTLSPPLLTRTKRRRMKRNGLTSLTIVKRMLTQIHLILILNQHTTPLTIRISATARHQLSLWPVTPNLQPNHQHSALNLSWMTKLILSRFYSPLHPSWTAQSISHPNQSWTTQLITNSSRKCSNWTQDNRNMHVTWWRYVGWLRFTRRCSWYCNIAIYYS